MKIAICFCGIVGGIKGKNGIGENIDITVPYKTIKKHRYNVKD